MKSKAKYVIGQRFNRLTIISLHRIDHRNRKFFLCLCDCGKEKIIQGSLMSSGNTRSCGCYSREQKKATRISENHCEITAIILSYKRHAKNRKFRFELTRQFVSEILVKDCFYCGAPPSNFMKTKNSIVGLKYNGIDRFDSKKHYTEDNCNPCCKICNNAKSNLSIVDFKLWAKRFSAMAEQWGSNA